METRFQLVGTVVSGLGEGARFTSIDWVVEAFSRTLGFAPHPGTFNLRMSGARWEAARAHLLAAPGIPITPSPGFCAAKCFRVELDGRLECAVVIPHTPDYPDDKFEIVAPVRVRDALGLADGEPVALTVGLPRRAFLRMPGGHFVEREPSTHRSRPPFPAGVQS